MYRWLKVISCLLLTSNLSAAYIYEANQSLFDLTNESGTTNLNAGDDQVSNAFNLGFTFDFYGQSFTQGRMATNGCLHFKTSGAYCSDYRPDPLTNQYTYTLLPFWTDLIRDNGSKMLAKSFSDKTVFGWYNLREYNRSNTDNSFEVILWTNDTFEFRYGALNIINHDVLIGEVGSGSSEVYQYLFHDECNVGSTNSSSCVNTNWNNTSFNTLLESGGSLYGVGTGNSVDCSNPLNDASCSGYADAYLSQQCGIDQLYSESCPYYWDAYDDFQCDLDPQYGPFCPGYRQQESVAYFNEDQFDYGYEESMTQYDTYEDEFMFEEHFFELEYDFFEEPEFVFEEEIIFEQVFMQEEYYEPFEPMQDMPMREEEIFMPIEDLLIDEFIFQETFLVEDFREPETFIEFDTIEELEEWFNEETDENFEERIEEELADLDEPQEEIFEEEVVEEVFEAIEERMAEAEVEEERVEREEIVEEKVFEEEFQVVERENAKGESSISKDMALRVVASTITTANQSVSGTNSGNSIHATGNSVAAGNAVNFSSNAGFSTSSSPSMSDQFASSTAQTNQVLNMSSVSVSDTSFNSGSVQAETVSTEATVASATTQTTQDQMDTSIASVGTDTESETTVENIIAKNLQTAQDQVAAKQKETGEYGSENAIIAVMGFLPGFNDYRAVDIPQKEFWYEPKSIYTNNTLSDNTAAFYELAGQSIKTLTDLKKLQPTL